MEYWPGRRLSTRKLPCGPVTVRRGPMTTSAPARPPPAESRTTPRTDCNGCWAESVETSPSQKATATKLRTAATLPAEQFFHSRRDSLTLRQARVSQRGGGGHEAVERGHTAPGRTDPAEGFARDP